MSSRVAHLSETSLYVEDLERSRRFYERVFGLKPVLEDERMVGLELPGSAILLLFARSDTAQAAQWNTGYDDVGAQHLCLAISQASLRDWERHLTLNGVIIEGRVLQPHGGTSLYFRDPDEHSLEVATPAACAGT